MGFFRLLILRLYCYTRLKCRQYICKYNNDLHNNFWDFQTCATLRMAAVTGNSTLMTTGTGFDCQVPVPLTTPGQAVTTPPTRHMAITSLCLLLLRTFKARQLKYPLLFTLQVRPAEKNMTSLWTMDIVSFCKNQRSDF